jgi:hypothetical protein
MSACVQINADDPAIATLAKFDAHAAAGAVDNGIADNDSLIMRLPR